MESTPTFDPIWDDVWGKDGYVVRYPYDFVVVFVHRYAPKDRPRSEVKVMEIACGTGNNLWFAAREGFSVAGIDASVPAIEGARKRFAEDGLSGDLRVGDFTALPYDDGSFDLVIDRGGIVCVGMSAGQKAVNEIHRVLRPGGRFLFNPYSDRHSSALAHKPGPDGLRPLHPEGSSIRGVLVAYYNRQDVENILTRGWKILGMEHWERVEYANPALPVHAEWRVIAEKTS